jgi:hypothetical protein
VLNNGVVSNDGGVACCDEVGVEIEVENEVFPLLRLLLLQEGLFLGLEEAVLVVDVGIEEDRDSSAPPRR